MSLYGALFGGVSGLKSQSSAIGIISDNISNVNTIGYKQATATFQTLVVNSTANSGSYQTGGVRGGTVLNVNKQGLLQSTESPTDLAISGNGFFVVKASSDTSITSAPLYTRAGSFTQDSVGNFKNPQGYFLQGWPLDREGRLPGAVGNLNTTAFTNFDSLKTVNVQSASGVAQATSLVTFGANLKASEVVYPGETKTVVLDTNNVSNRLQPADAIIADGEYGMQGGVNGVNRGDQFSISTGNGLQYSYEYGGFTIGRDISTNTATANYGDGALDNSSPIALAAGDIQFVSNGSGSSTYDITVPTHNLITGDTITLSNVAGFSPAGVNTALTQLDLPITRIDANTIRVTVSVAHTAGAANTGTTTEIQIRQFEGNILDATSPAQTFLNKLGTAGFTDESLSFSISTPTAGTVTFTYTTSTPNTSNGEFNNLSTLATAINNVSGITARVVDNKRLVVGAEDATESVTFANSDAVGTSTKRGIDWVKELDLKDVSSGTRRYSSLSGLAALVTGDDGVSATVNNALSTATLDIRVDDPLDTITFDDLPPATAIPTTANGITVASASYTAGTPISITIADSASTFVAGDTVYVSGFGATGLSLPGALPNGGPYTITSVSAGSSYTFQVTPTQSGTLSGTTFTANAGGLISLAGKANHGSVLGQLGLATSLNGTAYTGAARTTGALGPQYDPTGVLGKNMASGDITAQFSRNVRVYDGLGTGHDIRFSYIKIAQNRWRVEVHAIPADDIVTRAPLVDGQIAVGELAFNGDGTLRSISPGLPTIPSLNGSVASVPVGWKNGSVPSNLSFNFGTAGLPFGTVGATSVGLSDGLSQFDSNYNVNFANQNGAPVGELRSVAIDSKGVVIASYSNGQTQALFQLPLAQFANPNGTQAISGNVYSQTRDSGEVNLREAGTNGTGAVVASTLEQSNVDLAQQLTDLIVAQRSYQANTQVIKTTSELLQQLNQITG